MRPRSRAGDGAPSLLPTPDFCNQCPLKAGPAPGPRDARKPSSKPGKQEGSEAQAEGDRRRRLGRKLSNPERPPREEPDELTIVCLAATQRNRDKHSVLVAAVASILSYCAASAQNQPSQDQTSAPTEFQSSTRNKPAIVTIPEAATDTPGVPVSQTSGSNLSLRADRSG